MSAFYKLRNMKMIEEKDKRQHKKKRREKQSTKQNLNWMLKRKKPKLQQIK